MTILSRLLSNYKKNMEIKPVLRTGRKAWYMVKLNVNKALHRIRTVEGEVNGNN